MANGFCRITGQINSLEAAQQFVSDRLADQGLRLVKFEQEGGLGYINLSVSCAPADAGPKIAQDESSIIKFHLAHFPAQCGTLISHRTFVGKIYENKGIAQKLMPVKFAIAKEAQYSSLLCTVVLDWGHISPNMPFHTIVQEKTVKQIHIMEKFGWVKIKEFKNLRTNHLIGVFWKDLG